MTVIAVVAAGDVRRILAGGSIAVVAGAATSQNLRVIDGERRHKRISSVAVRTYISCIDVCRALTDCFDTVVTAYAVSRDVDVVEVGRHPAV